ncbi:hypothetical protein [Streptomyces sp. NPDC058308]|uniref:hypothetical protein n=1 Tax=Streptomyces sp. NPDC058308 TaxID=3346440 RepID=UPI0036E5CE3E
MDSFPPSGRADDDEPDEEIRRKERELAEREAKVARRERAATGLWILRAAIAAAEAAHGNPAYRAAGHAVRWVIDRLQDDIE